MYSPKNRTNLNLLKRAARRAARKNHVYLSGPLKVVQQGSPQSLESHFLTRFFSICGQNYTLEWFSEAGSAPIRSAVTFYFDIDVRIFFSTSSKNIFSIDQKKSHRKKWKFHNFKKSKIFKEKTQILKFSIFEILKMFDFWDFFNYFFARSPFLKKLEKNSEINIEVKFHCGSNGSTLSLWKCFQNHSKPL